MATDAIVEPTATDLYELFKTGRLQPVTSIPDLAPFSTATRIGWARSGVFPALKVGSRYYSSSELVRNAIIAKGMLGPKAPDQSPLPSVEEVKTRLRSRGVKV